MEAEQEEQGRGDNRKRPINYVSLSEEEENQPAAAGTAEKPRVKVLPRAEEVQRKHRGSTEEAKAVYVRPLLWVARLHRLHRQHGDRALAPPTPLAPKAKYCGAPPRLPSKPMPAKRAAERKATGGGVGEPVLGRKQDEASRACDSADGDWGQQR